MDFLKKWKITAVKAAAAGVAAAVFAGLVIAAGAGEGFDARRTALGLVLGVLAAVYILAPFRFPRIVSVLLAVILPVCTLCALECFTHVPQDLKQMIFFANLLFYYLLYAVCTFLAGRLWLGYLIGTFIPMLFGLVNYYVVQFRGHPIVPWDLFSLRTALSVAGNYEVTMTWRTAFVLMAFLWIFLISAKLTGTIRRRIPRIAGCAASVLCMVVFLVQLQKADVQSWIGMDTTLFTLNVLYRNNGIAGGFLGNLHFLNLSEPDGYSPAKVEEIQEEAAKLPDKGSAGTPSGKGKSSQLPNVILIMNEAFSDLSVYGDFATSEEVMPFFKQLQQECAGGEVYVSVKGGNTANTEFELLTGDSMAFLPSGSVAYQQYLHDTTPSLAWYLKSLGYQTLAIHPYRRAGWDRDKVYEYFGFDRFLDQNSFESPLKYRGYISDLSGFEKIIEEYNQKEEGKPLFAFEVTMQNHGGYSRETPDFDSYLKLPDVKQKSTSLLATEKYLTLMNLTDRALQELVMYFENLDDPTVILMLGDHQPSDYITNVVRRLTGNGTEDTLEDLELGYRVPFVIWSNFDMEHSWYDRVSVNYLGGLLLEKAGIPLTGYQKWLENLRSVLPVINANAICDAEGNFYSPDDETWKEELNTYKILQYNHMTDRKHRVNSFFGMETE